MLQVSCTNRTMGNRQVATTIPFWGKKESKRRTFSTPFSFNSYMRFPMESACGQVDSFSRAASKGYPNRMVGTRAMYCLTFPRLDIKVSAGLVPSEGCSCLSPHFRWFSHNLWQSPAVSLQHPHPCLHIPTVFSQCLSQFSLCTRLSLCLNLCFLEGRQSYWITAYPNHLIFTIS